MPTCYLLLFRYRVEVTLVACGLPGVLGLTGCRGKKPTGPHNRRGDDGSGRGGDRMLICIGGRRGMQREDGRGDMGEISVMEAHPPVTSPAHAAEDWAGWFLRKRQVVAEAKLSLVLLLLLLCLLHARASLHKLVTPSAGRGSRGGEQESSGTGQDWPWTVEQAEGRRGQDQWDREWNERRAHRSPDTGADRGRPGQTGWDTDRGRLGLDRGVNVRYAALLLSEHKKSSPVRGFFLLQGREAG